MIEKKVKIKSWCFLHFRSDLEQDPDPEPDPLIHETDPRIRIRIKMKRIRNTGWACITPNTKVLIDVLLGMYVFANITVRFVLL